jgi:hypothetical protein
MHVCGEKLITLALTNLPDEEPTVDKRQVVVTRCLEKINLHFAMTLVLVSISM